MCFWIKLTVLPLQSDQEHPAAAGALLAADGPEDDAEAAADADPEEAPVPITPPAPLWVDISRHFFNHDPPNSLVLFVVLPDMLCLMTHHHSQGSDRVRGRGWRAPSQSLRPCFQCRLPLQDQDDGQGGE